MMQSDLGPEIWGARENEYFRGVVRNIWLGVGDKYCSSKALGGGAVEKTIGQFRDKDLGKIDFWFFQGRSKFWP